VRNHYDLVKSYTIPDGIELKFLPGGIIDATGTITGDSTSIVADPGQQIFSTTTTVAGTWKAPIATSAWVGNNAGKYTALTARLDSSLVTSIKINAASSNVVGISSPSVTGKLNKADSTGVLAGNYVTHVQQTTALTSKLNKTDSTGVLSGNYVTHKYLADTYFPKLSTDTTGTTPGQLLI
jgi:hypothetical protein